TAVSTAPHLGEYAPQVENAGYAIKHLPLPKRSSVWSRVKYYKMLITLLRRECYDVMHIHRSDAMWGMAFCAWMAGERSVFTFHNVFPSRTLSFIYHCLLRFTAKKFFGCKYQTISDSVYKHELNFYHNQTQKIHNWYSNKRFFPATQTEKVRIREEISI